MFQAKMSGGGISGKVDCGALVVPCCQIIFMFSPHVATLHIHLVHVLHGSSPGRNEHSMKLNHCYVVHLKDMTKH